MRGIIAWGISYQIFNLNSGRVSAIPSQRSLVETFKKVYTITLETCLVKKVKEIHTKKFISDQRWKTGETREANIN